MGRSEETGSGERGVRRIMNGCGEEPSVTGVLRNGVTTGEEGQRGTEVGAEGDEGGGGSDEAKKHRTPLRNGE